MKTNKKQISNPGVSQAPRRRGRPPKAAAEPPQPSRHSPTEGADPGSEDLLNLADLGLNHEPDPHEIDNMTDRIFGSVLSRYGWQVQNGHLEDVGEEGHRAAR